MLDKTYTKFVDQIDLYIGRDAKFNILEAGACNCEDSSKLTSIFPNATVYAFECNPETIPLCQKEAELNPRISFRPLALGQELGTMIFKPIDTKKTVTVHPDGNPGASSFFEASKEYPIEKYAQNNIKVEMTRADAIGLPPMDLLWLDAQGSELNILKGMGTTLDNVKIIKIEVQFKEQYLGAPMYEEVEAWLESKGFRFVRWIDKFEWFGDALYVREGL